ncbi:BadF/BadG/BcrA/BcrD ATPase family protein [Granulicella tundricola]|uniref:BadF/BadG/BcrA/BcrD ATPase family protein n=1 Tax=Granulicella tundricola TaxID=940615 RepID=UPI0002F609D1|nr:BadF/BadG/BcrA/BcrD ATPase family protein [Granulicella tundricola]
MGFYVGVDAGGTKTECWLGNETEVLGRATCGSVKLIRVGEEVAEARLRVLLGEVEAMAGVSLQEVTRTCVGLAGVSITSVREFVRRVITSSVGGDLEICGDEEIALDGAFRGGRGYW